MSCKADLLQNELVSLLSEFALKVEINNGLGKNDLAKSAEFLFKDLLAVIYDQQFTLNSVVNGDTFDLVGAKKMLVQVTSRTDARKIKETLASYWEKDYPTKFGKIYFALIATKKDYRAETFEGYDARGFDYKSQILGLTELVNLLDDIDSLEQALDIARKHLLKEQPEDQRKNLDLLAQMIVLDASLEESRSDIEEMARSNRPIPGSGSSEQLEILTDSLLGLVCRLQERTKHHHAALNADISQPHEPMRQLVEQLRMLHSTSMAGFKRLQKRIGEARELARLVHKMESAQEEIAKGEAELAEIEQEQRELTRQMESLQFEMKILGAN